MLRKAVSGIVLALLLTSTLAAAFKVQPTKGWTGTVYIRADGSVDPPDAPVQQNGNLYTLTDDITDSTNGIVVERDNITIDGNGHMLQGTGVGIGIGLSERRHVTIKNSQIRSLGAGIMLDYSVDNTICGNNITLNTYPGIYLEDCSNNSISGNNVAKNGEGIWLRLHSNRNTICENSITNNSPLGIYLEDCSNNSISRNSIISNAYGIWIFESSNNRIYHNNFVNNTDQAYSYRSVNVWDDGYPSGGNYWSDYNHTDFYHGTCQNETGSDGIGDTPYFIDENNQDNYPLMKPYPWGLHDIGITRIATSRTVVGQGFDLHINMTMLNYGDNTETFNVTVYCNETAITLPNEENYMTVTLASRESTTVAIAWNTSGFAKGNYTIWAYAWPVPDETDTTDNTLTNGIITMSIPGDVDGDFNVDIFDVVKITGYFGKKRGDPLFQPNADIDGNSEINIFDVVICTGHYGQKWP